MGLSNSTAQNTSEEKFNKIKKLFEEDDKTEDILETLNLTEFKVEEENNATLSKLKPIPKLIGGDFENQYNQKKRYTKYDLFKMLQEMDSEFQRGGNDNTENGEESDLSDTKAMEHIKNVILKELNNLKANKANQLGGNCGCDGTKENKMPLKKINMKNIILEEDNELVGGYRGKREERVDDSSSSTSSSTSSSSSTSIKPENGKRKGKKQGKKTKQNKNNLKQSTDTDSSKFFIETSESGKGDNEEVTSNGKNDDSSDNKKNNKKSSSSSDEQKDSEEGLSIFPFNSSDVKSSLSVKNYRMLRRKI